MELPTRFLLALVVALLAALEASSAPACGEIRVSGASSISGAADKASISLRVEAVDSTTARAKDRVALGSARAVAALAKAGVDTEEDLTTSSYNIWDSSRWDPKTGTRVRRFRVSHSLTISTTNLTALGQIIDAAASVESPGGKSEEGEVSVQMNGPSFQLTDAAREELANRARRAAVDDGAARAALFADAAGVPLGPLVHLSEFRDSSAPSPRPGPMYRTAAAMPMQDGAAETVIMPGEVSESQRVYLTYALAGCGPTTRAGAAYWRGEAAAKSPANRSRSGRAEAAAPVEEEEEAGGDAGAVDVSPRTAGEEAVMGSNEGARP